MTSIRVDLLITSQQTLMPAYVNNRNKSVNVVHSCPHVTRFGSSLVPYVCLIPSYFFVMKDEKKSHQQQIIVGL